MVPSTGSSRPQSTPSFASCFNLAQPHDSCCTSLLHYTLHSCFQASCRRPHPCLAVLNMLTDVTGGSALGTGSTARGWAAGSIGGRARPQVKMTSSSKGKVLHQANYGHSSTNVEYYLPPRAIGLVAQNQSALLGNRLVRRAGSC